MAAGATENLNLHGFQDEMRGDWDRRGERGLDQISCNEG